ncbi:hypothetical protein X756_24245 [Mesorhizobium sp. LSHC412B00]|nr:hypothetical protein X756_24245 [Mesorhizobium sp. LSHC412B00]
MRPLTSRTEEEKAVYERADHRGYCDEGARDMARDIAATEAYVTSRRERKKVESCLPTCPPQAHSECLIACDYEDQTVPKTSST